MGNLCLNGGIPWLSDTEGSLCFSHFLDRPTFKDNYSSLWSNLKTKIVNCNQTDGIAMSNFINNLDSQQNFLLLLGGLDLPFDDASITINKRFVASVVGKLHDLKAP